MSKRDSTSNRKAFFHKLSCSKASSLRWKDQVYDERQYQLQETIQGPGLSARLPTQGLKHQGVLGWRQLSSETSEVINEGHTSQTEIHFKEYSSTTCALNVSGEFFTWSHKVSWNRFRPSCKKSSISFWRRRQSAITASWPVVSSPLWFVPWALPNGVYLLVVNLTDSRHAVRHLAFILTFQTNLKLLVHPWYMSQRVHADTEHRRGENLKRKTQQWHYLSPHNPASLPTCTVPPTSPAFADKLPAGLWHDHRKR